MDAVIRQNKVRVYLYMTFLILILGSLGTFLSQTFHWGLTGTSIFLAVGATINVVAYFFSDRLILRSAQAKP
ncbi:TPA: hypothetical protein DDW35_09055, partial [Candidatus Sumerlaeota bacterium]|nr:hypothetical protein [Candidatus Sumerlaeota bacterium]